jgi:hypothetical protein
MSGATNSICKSARELVESRPQTDYRPAVVASNARQIENLAVARKPFSKSIPLSGIAVN